MPDTSTLTLTLDAETADRFRAACEQTAADLRQGIKLAEANPPTGPTVLRGAVQGAVREAMRRTAEQASTLEAAAAWFSGVRAVERLP